MKKANNFHPFLQYHFKKRKAVAFRLYTVLLGCFLGILAPIHAQSDLNANGQIHRINTNGNYSDYKIPTNTNGYNTITFWLTGGDGGHRKVPGLCQTKGGEGAYVAVKFLIGNNAGQLKTGGTIRFIPGYEGESKTGNGIDGCGGGGGTAVLYHDPNANITCSDASLNLSDAGTCWVILGVAGGGGGAYSSGLCGGQEGKGGNSGTNGTNSGGQNGQGGMPAENGSGGGYLSAGGQNSSVDGKKGGLTGGNGGLNGVSFAQKGGYGYGGGGGTIKGGAGGGGYSGGSGGGDYGAGGGGGSFANSSANYSHKTGGGSTNSPSDGHVDYVFQVGATRPVAVCKNITVALNANGHGVYHAIDLDGGSYDPNGDPLTYRMVTIGLGASYYDSVTTTCSDLGPRTEILVVDDGTNDSYCFSNITIEDAIPPAVTCKSSLTVALDATGHATIAPGNLISSSSDNCGIVSQTLSKSSFDCSNTGNNTVTVTVADASDNSNTCTATVTVQAAYTFSSCQPGFNVSIPSGACAAYVNLSAPAFSSVCYTLKSQVCTTDLSFCTGIDATNKSGNYPPGAYYVKWMVYNDNNNQVIASCNTYFNVLPNADKPTARCKDRTLPLNAAGIVNIAPGTLDNGSSDLCGTLTESINISSFDCSNVGINTVTLTVTNIMGNTSTCTSTVTVQDHLPPTALCKSKTLSLDAAGQVTVLVSDINNGSSDNCGISMIFVTPSTFDCSNVGTNTATLHVHDVNSNGAICTATVTIRDLIAPAALCNNKTVQLNASGQGSITTADINNGSTDACGIANLTLSKSSFNCSNVGTNIVTLSVTDVNSNTGTCTATVTVVDGIAPTVVCKPVTTYLNAAGAASITTADVFQSGSDNCSTVNQQSVSPATLNCGNIGANTVTLTVNDGHGNTGTCTATVTVVDAIAPTVVCKAYTANLDAAGNTIVTTANVFQSGSDNCGTVNQQSVSPNAFNCSNLGANTVTLTVNDGHGNTNTCTATVTVADAMAPTVVCHAITTFLNNLGAVGIIADDVFGSGTDNCGTVNLVSVSPNTFNCSNIGANLVTLTANDGHGNTGTCTTTVTIVDAMPPTVVCKSFTANLDATGNVVVAAASVFQSGTDNCGTVNPQSVSPGTFNCSNLGTNTVTLTANDSHGNTNTCTATVTVVDAVAPTVVCKSYTANLDAAGSASITTGNVFQSGSDNCGTVNQVSVSPNTFNCGNIGANTVTLTANDGHGNTGTCTATVTVADVIAPTVSCKTYTANLDAAGSASVATSNVFLSGSDNCGTVNQQSVSPAAFNCSNIGTNTVTLTVNDGHGNTGTCTATVTVIDAIPPTVVCKSYTANLDAAGNASVTTANVFQSGTDNCGTVNQVSVSPNTFNCGNLGTNTVTLTVNDSHGNTNTCSATVTVADNVAPTVSCKTYTANLDAAGSASVSTANVFLSGSDNCGTVNQQSVSPSSFTCNNLGVNTVTLTVNDSHGNTGTCTATVTVVDNIAPTVVCKAYTANLDAAGSASVSTGNVFLSGADNCGVVNQQSVTPGTFNCNNLGANTVTLTVNDGHGNTGTCTTTVTVVDNIAPTVVCKAYTANLDNAGSTSITTANVFQSGADNCGTVNQVSVLPNSFNCGNIGTNTVTLTVNDGHGNTGTCTATVTVTDAIPPTVVCKAYTANLNAAGSASVATSNVFLSGADNCGVVNQQSISPSSFNCGNIGANTVTLTVNDSHGNTATCTTTVTVVDAMPPTVVCKPFTAFLDNSGAVNITTANVFLSGADNCGMVNQQSVVPAAFNCGNIGANTVTLTVNDGHGNTNSCTATVTVADAIAPTMLCRNVTLSLDGAGQATLTVAQVNNGSFDNCGISYMELSRTLFTCTNLGSNMVTLGGKDASNNRAECSATITVEDHIAPVAKCKNVLANLEDNGLVKVAGSAVDNGSTDNCSVTFSLQPNTFNCGNIGLNTVTLTATDPSGNTATCTATVTVRDISAPVAKCKNATVYIGVDGHGKLLPEQMNNESSDNCGIASWTLSQTEFNCSDLSGPTYLVTMSIRDMNGNSSSCTAYVTVRDAIAPTAVCADVTVTLGSNGTVAVYGAALAASSTDNCAVWSYSPVAKVYTAANLGANNLPIMVKDWSGNAATCVSVVTVLPYQHMRPTTSDRDAAKSNDLELGIRVYPNPTAGDATLEFELPEAQEYKLLLYDLSGRMVLLREGKGEKGWNSLPILSGNIAPGVYFLEFRSAGLKGNKRLIIQE